jgi:tubulin-specific chaperone A
VFPSLKKKLAETVAELQSLIVSCSNLLLLRDRRYIDCHLQAEEAAKGSESNVAHITAAKEAIAQAKTAEREVS